MRLLSLFGLDARLRRVRAAVGESALAAEDRVQLVRMAWDDEKARLKQMAALAVVVIGLTTVSVALLSVAVVVHFWDTPQRTTAAWVVAGAWIVLWLAAVIALVAASRGAADALTPARQEFERDFAWLQARFGSDDLDKPPRDARPATRAELQMRIESQRARIARLQEGADAAEVERAHDAPPPDESAAAAAVRIARSHPVAVGVAAAAAVAILRPRRVLRLTAFLAPVLWRMR